MEPDKDYATQERLAIYLENGWSDFLFGCHDQPQGVGYPNPLRDTVPPTFPERVAALTENWAKALGHQPGRYCDVGGATGRTLFEAASRFADLRELVMIEPSATFCRWAERFLMTDDPLPKVPRIATAGRLDWLKARSRPPAVTEAARRVKIVNAFLEQASGYGDFDLVTCLNVADRHPDPAALVRELSARLRPGGLLVMACPFDFHTDSTPDRTAWITDLNQLFDGQGDWTHLGQEDVYYDYRSHNRSWTRLVSQVVAKQWRGDGG